jgi:hypothetical protein
VTEGGPLLDRRRLLATVAAMPLAWLLRPRGAEAAVALPKPYRITSDIVLPDTTTPATLSVPLASGATDRLQLADIAWQGHGCRADFAADPTTGAMLLRLAWPGGPRPRGALLTQTVMLSEPDGGRTMQQFVDRMSAAAILVPAQSHAIRFQSIVTPPAKPHPAAKLALPAKTRRHPGPAAKPPAKSAHKPAPPAKGTHGSVVQARLPALAKPSGVR